MNREGLRSFKGTLAPVPFHSSLKFAGEGTWQRRSVVRNFFGRRRPRRSRRTVFRRTSYGSMEWVIGVLIIIVLVLILLRLLGML